jgi:hypothetical protein
VATALEDQVAAEQAEHEAQERRGLFDPDPYTWPVPRVDGTPADAIELVFSGKVVLDPLNEADLALIERLKLDGDATFHIEAAIAGKAMKIKRGEDETTATHAITCRVHTLYREAGEE